MSPDESRRASERASCPSPGHKPPAHPLPNLGWRSPAQRALGDPPRRCGHPTSLRPRGQRARRIRPTAEPSPPGDLPWLAAKPFVIFHPNTENCKGSCRDGRRLERPRAAVSTISWALSRSFTRRCWEKVTNASSSSELVGVAVQRVFALWQLSSEVFWDKRAWELSSVCG
jgi:hypothetical protein